jgi:hypothetical protein
MSSLLRRIAALAALFALLFAQLAVSAYACPMQSAAPMRAAAEASQAGDATALPCEMALATPNLCDRHCDYDAAAVGTLCVDARADHPPLLLPWRAVPAAALATVPLAAVAFERPPPRPLSRSPLTLFGNLRI